MLIPESFKILSKNLEILPGVGEKTAERFAFSIEKKDYDEIENLSEALINFKKNIKYCSICNCLSDDIICSACSDENRNHKIICVVEDSKTAFSIDKTNKYNGVYYVLNNLISPSQGINPDSINLLGLQKIVKDAEEVIIALNPSIDGEITSLYIQKKLENLNIKVSRLSYGIPLGSEIEYLDPLMISKAFDDRKYLS